MSTLSQLRNNLSENPLLKEQLQVLFVSVDRERDTAKILDEYVGYFNPEFIGVTGSEESLENFANGNIGEIFEKQKKRIKEYINEWKSKNLEEIVTNNGV